jgi:hypothetical protein
VTGDRAELAPGVWRLAPAHSSLLPSVLPPGEELMGVIADTAYCVSSWPAPLITPWNPLLGSDDAGVGVQWNNRQNLSTAGPLLFPTPLHPRDGIRGRKGDGCHHAN